MHLKETLTIKPDGFKIKVRPRTDNDRGAYAGRGRDRGGGIGCRADATGADASGTQHAAAGALRIQSRHRRGTRDPRRRSRRGQRLCDQTRRRSTTIVGKLPEQGGVLIFCASYNGAPPDNATQFVNWLGGDLPKDAFRKAALRGVRLRQQRLGRDLSVDPAHDRRAIGGAWRAQRLCARRGRRPQRPRWTIRKLVRQARAAGDEGIRHRIPISPAAPTTSRSTRSSRWRHQRSTPSSRSAASRR